MASTAALRKKQLDNDLTVLRYCFENLDELAEGKLESPQKLVLFYAGFTAIRSLCHYARKQKTSLTGNSTLDKRIWDGVSRWISHSTGANEKTILRVTTFRTWARKVLKHSEQLLGTAAFDARTFSVGRPA